MPDALALLVPLAGALKSLNHPPPLAVFVAGGLAVGVLAEWMRRATEQVATVAGPAIRGWRPRTMIRPHHGVADGKATRF